MPLAAAGRTKGERRPELCLLAVPEISETTCTTDVAESRARTCRHVSARGCREGASGSLGLQRPPRFFQEASRSQAREGRPPAPGSRGSGSTRLLRRVPAPGTPGGGAGCGLAAGGARERAPRSSGTLPPDSRPHGCGASPGGGEGGGCFWAWAWGCCGRRLTPCPILECYSVTDNRVTRAAADVLTASIGRRNKEGRGPSAGLSQPGAPARSDWLPRFLGGSEGEEGAPGGRAKGDRGRALGPPRGRKQPEGSHQGEMQKEAERTVCQVCPAGTAQRVGGAREDFSLEKDKCVKGS
ncbi:unnamed protein product [Rangifer tarandus platyrhynchus]|uniref:Uncharacterized protein n=3 Tax=Rangifer tarandus platyrhynchus TaxID=3082113 RepID=A0AC60A923_RANTA|nr:unnamed protein product [Rangifer tarandus platyrhynchus]CAI9714248.1 unnamed protein product [Rangifer tarandus platyrhynchus]